jgi:MYXO-CTERM domain-containing protein
MADKEYTLFELHFDGGFQVGPERLDAADDAETDADTETADDVEIDVESDGGGPGALLLGLLGLVVIAAVVRRVVGGEDDLEIETAEDHPDDVEEIESA